jgi:hypothetical protein
MTLSGVFKFLASAALALVAAILLSLAIKPQLRAALLAEFNDPADLPALPGDARVHYEPQARACAEAVAAVLLRAVAKIEAEHGRPFARPPVVGVYDDFETYARANGLNDRKVAGVSRAGRAVLSPTLCKSEGDRLASVLTHELSHVHFFGWRPRKAPRPPHWFTEGLAVLASDGGAAESVSDAEAREAIRHGYAIILDQSPWTNFLSIPFAAAPPCDAGCDLRTFRQRLAYRQAALFIGWLRESDRRAFFALMRGLESGEAFDAAFRVAFGAAPSERWTDFSAGLQASR